MESRRAERKAAADAARLPMPRSWQSNWYGSNGAVWTFSNGRFEVGAPDFRKLAGDSRDNSIVAACLGWIARTWPQARPVVLTLSGDDLKPEGSRAFEWER